MEDWDLKLCSHIIWAIMNKGFLSAITKAERGYGKSMYNLKVMAQVYYKIKQCTVDEAWEYALDSMIFTPDEFMNRIEQNLYKGTVSPIWCIDDATVHFSSYLYFINLYQASLLNAAFDTIRTAVSSLLINCPSKHRLLSGLRNYDDYEITLYKVAGSKYMRKAVGIKWYSLPDGHRKFKKSFEDHFSVYVPDQIYNKYMEMRKRYLKEISAELKKLRDQLASKKANIKTFKKEQQL